LVADKHESVLLSEALTGLAVVLDGCYVDGTYGRGGHSAELLARLGPDGRVLALDKDPAAVVHGRERFRDDLRFTIVHAGFEDLQSVVANHCGTQRVSGVLLDIGTSSPQLDEAERGFSFSRDGPLDMRMNDASGITAANWLESVGEEELLRVLRVYGEERHARRIGRAIIARRSLGAISSTRMLAEIVADAAPRTKSKIHPATRIFQAIRIVVNRELEALEAALSQSLNVLAAGGRIVVISFHSLEDRIVKRFIARESRGDPAYAGLPDMPIAARPRLAGVGRLIRPGAAEIERNPRSRSARMRIAERLNWDISQ
jgi:16S rRNA (cytosine1402-N4)-methyltransferase